MFRLGGDITGFPLGLPQEVSDELAGGKGLDAPRGAAGPYLLRGAGLAQKGSSPTPFPRFWEAYCHRLESGDDPSFPLKSAALLKEGGERPWEIRPQGRVAWEGDSGHHCALLLAEQHRSLLDDQGALSLPEGRPGDLHLPSLPANKSVLPTGQVRGCLHVI